MLDNDKDQQQKSHELKIYKMVFDGSILLVILGFFFILIYLFRDRDQIIGPLITGLGGFVAGAAGGFGLAKSGRY